MHFLKSLNNVWKTALLANVGFPFSASDVKQGGNLATLHFTSPSTHTYHTECARAGLAENSENWLSISGDEVLHFFFITFVITNNTTIICCHISLCDKLIMIKRMRQIFTCCMAKIPSLCQILIKSLNIKAGANWLLLCCRCWCHQWFFATNHKSSSNILWAYFGWNFFSYKACEACFSCYCQVMSDS